MRIVTLLLRRSLLGVAIIAGGCGGAHSVVDLGTLPDASGCAAGSTSEDVTFAASDGLVVHGTATRPCGSGGSWVVLAHQLCSDRSEWSAKTHDWVFAFSARGISTLAIDLRGHGASTAFPDGSTHDLCAEPGASPLFLGMVDDVTAATTYARSTGNATSVALVGASIGSNSAIVAYSKDGAARMVVALSPGLDYRGITTTDPVELIAARPALLEAAEDDAASASSVRSLSMSNPSITTKIWPSGGHANRILTAHPEELGRVVDLVASSLTVH